MSDKQQKWYKVAKISDLPENRVMTATAGTQQVCLVNYNGKISALDNRCPHQGGPLGEGQIENEWVICPWHAYEYDPHTGKAPEGFEDCVRPFPLELREGDIYVAIIFIGISRARFLNWRLRHNTRRNILRRFYFNTRITCIKII